MTLLGRFVRRSASAVALAMVFAACSGSSPSDVGSLTAPSLATPLAGASTAPSASGQPTAASSASRTASPSGSPRSSADALRDVPTADGVLNALAIADDTLVAGGFTGPTFTSSIVVFADGAWSIADVPAAPGQVTGIARLGERWIAVGNGLPDIRAGFVWASPDGRAWETVQTMEDAALYDIVVGAGVAVAVGARLDAEMTATATAWSSTDGTTWIPAKVAAAAKTAMGSVTTTPDGFAATGDRPLGVMRPIWTATAATSWAALKNDLGDQLLPVDIVHWDDTLVVVGASGKSGDQHPFVARSSDGLQWDQTNLSTAEGYASAAAVAGQRLVVAGIDADRLTLWSLNAGDWRANTYEESGASISALAWTEGWGLVGVGARDGRQAVWSFGSE